MSFGSEYDLSQVTTAHFKGRVFLLATNHSFLFFAPRRKCGIGKGLALYGFLLADSALKSF
jgi:hypothetical protein